MKFSRPFRNLVYSTVFLSVILILHLLSQACAIKLEGRRRLPKQRVLSRVKPSRKPTLNFNPLLRNRSSLIFNRQRPIDTTTAAPAIRLPREKQSVYLGVVLPPTTFRRRQYTSKIKKTIIDFHEKSNGSHFVNNYDFGYRNVIIQYMKEISSSPTATLQTLCDEFLRNNVSSILYLFNLEFFGRSTASVQYFFQLSSYLGIPVISWNADNSGFERRMSSLQLQLAPSIEHQAAAMLSILQRYSWPKFAVVTTEIAGHNDFIQAVRDVMQKMESESSQHFTLMEAIVVTSPEKDLTVLKNSEVRIMFLYATRSEAGELMQFATGLGLTGKNYLWIAAQSVIQSMPEAVKGLPVGMLGVHFDTSEEALTEEIEATLSVFVYGLRDYVEEEAARNTLPNLNPGISCDTGDARWEGGANFYRYLRKAKINLDNSKKRPTLEFNSDGTRKSVELKIMNLRPDVTNQLLWEEIGTWNSWKEKGLEVKDIVWPENSHVPPNGIPDKFHLKVTFMEEPPFINMAPPHPETGKCSANRGILCRVASEDMMKGVNASVVAGNSSYYKCCSGFCIDLLLEFSKDLGFSYDFFRVGDGIWGAIVNGKWTGLPGAIINGDADMIMTSIKINSEREEVLDFSIPFLETGVTIVVSKRTGIISPTAFLEPFDSLSWLLVAAVAIQVAASSIFIFEWLSPYGFNMKFHPPPGQRFSLLRTLWLVWAILFQAAVNIDVPRSVTGRVMGNVWAMFALIFLAIYTANLAAFMITREEYYDLSGIEDKKFMNPTSVKPPFRFGTTLHGNTDVLLKKSFPEMHTYMRKFYRTSPVEGLKAVKKGELDAFLYDATVLEYLTGQDDECRLLTVGSWYALTGYGVAFSRNSKYISLFNDQIMKYRQNGFLERLTRFWFTGACKAERDYNSSSEPLALEQFMSTFFLLGCGIVLGFMLVTIEFLYFKYASRWIRSWRYKHLFNLVSMSMGRPLASMMSSQDSSSSPKDTRIQPVCEDPLCDMQLWKIKHELDMAHLRLFYLEEQLVTCGIWTHEEARCNSINRSSIDAGDIPNDEEINTESTITGDFESSPSKSETLGLEWHSSCGEDISPYVDEGLRRRESAKEFVTSTGLIRKPLMDRNVILEIAEKETVL